MVLLGCLKIWENVMVIFIYAMWFQISYHPTSSQNSHPVNESTSCLQVRTCTSLWRTCLATIEIDRVHNTSHWRRVLCALVHTSVVYGCVSVYSCESSRRSAAGWSLHHLRLSHGHQRLDSHWRWDRPNCPCWIDAQAQPAPSAVFIVL